MQLGKEHAIHLTTVPVIRDETIPHNEYAANIKP